MAWYRTKTLLIEHASDDDVRAIYRALLEHEDACYTFDLPESDHDVEALGAFGCANDRNPPDLDGFFVALSRRFPRALLTVEWYDSFGPLDTGRIYFQNGQVQRVAGTLSFPPFEPTKAEPVSTIM